jgi:hypothetical protein
MLERTPREAADCDEPWDPADRGELGRRDRASTIQIIIKVTAGTTSPP